MVVLPSELISFSSGLSVTNSASMATKSPRSGISAAVSGLKVKSYRFFTNCWPMKSCWGKIISLATFYLNLFFLIMRPKIQIIHSPRTSPSSPFRFFFFFTYATKMIQNGNKKKLYFWFFQKRKTFRIFQKMYVW